MEILDESEAALIVVDEEGGQGEGNREDDLRSVPLAAKGRKESSNGAA